MSIAGPLNANGDVVYFMSVGVSLTRTAEQSFEELRIQDYIKSYSTTGRPPQPCPQSPDTPNARAALGLPPLFVPVTIPNDAITLTQSRSGSDSTIIRNPSDLPAHHIFQATKDVLGEPFQSISAQAQFSFFSPEELRVYAYRAGNVTAPSSAIPSLSSTSTTGINGIQPGHPFYANDSNGTAYFTATVTPGASESFMSITASPKFDKHSFEELRIAYLSAGKELGSSGMSSRGGFGQAPPTMYGRPRGDAVSSSSSSSVRGTTLSYSISRTI